MTLRDPSNPAAGLRRRLLPWSMHVTAVTAMLLIATGRKALSITTLLTPYYGPSALSF